MRSRVPVGASPTTSMHENSLFAEVAAPSAHEARLDPSAALAAPAGADGANWGERWDRLASDAGIAAGEALLIALSGGSDSVLLLFLAQQASLPHPLRAVHVDHGLRGEQSDEDARFCERLCRRLGVDFSRRRIALDAAKPGLEARARAERYRVLIEESRAFGNATIVTAHHADDALETLLMRWTRGTRAGGLAALAPRRSFKLAPQVSVVRPLVALRKAQLTEWLAQSGMQHREDSSNSDLDFARNRVRRQLLPAIENVAGSAAIENLFAFAHAVSDLERTLEHATAHLQWTPIPHANARGGHTHQGGGLVSRGALMALSPALRKCAVARLLLSGTLIAPGRALLDSIAADLREGRVARRDLSAGWSLHLRGAELVLLPPRHPAAENPPAPASELPFPPSELRPGEHEYHLSLPGLVRLGDGRKLSAQVLRPSAPRAVPRNECTVELDLGAVADPRVLRVRFPRPGDRFHALGAPGSKSLARFLADRGIPRGDRPHVPLVTCGPEILWVAGVRPADGPKVGPKTLQRLRLELELG